MNKRGEERLLAVTLDNRGYTYSNMGRYRAARGIWQEAIEHYEKIGNSKDAAQMRELINKLPR